MISTHIYAVSFILYSVLQLQVTISLQPKQFLEVFLVIQFPHVGIFQFCSSKNIFIPPLLLKTGFVQHGIHCWQFFPSIILRRFLGAIVSYQQLSHIIILLYIMHCLSLPAFNVFFFSFDFRSLTIICVSMTFYLFCWRIW